MKAVDDKSQSAPKYEANPHLNEASMNLLVTNDAIVVVNTSNTEMEDGRICLLILLFMSFCKNDVGQEEGQTTLC